MRQFHPLLLTIFILCGLVSYGQDFYPPVVNYSTKDFGKERNAENYCSVQDQRGIMYFGNSHGILEFDGEKWNYIQVGTGSFVRSLAVDSTGIIYTGMYGDFGCLLPDSTGLLVFKSFLPKIKEEDQFFSVVWNIYATKTKVYFQTEEAFFEYNCTDEKITVVYPKTSFHTSFLIDSTFYLREREKGIVKYEKGKLQKLKGTEEFEGFGVFGIHKLKDDSLLIITQELGLFKWKNDSLVPIPDNNIISLSSIGIYGSVLLSDGNIGLNTNTNGLIIINTDGQIIKRIDRLTGIRSNDVRHVFQDRDLNLWMALGNGISKVNYYSPLSYFDEKTGVEGNISAITRFKGLIYLGASDGLLVQDSSLFGARKFRNTLVVKEQVWDFCEVNGVLYFGAANGVFKTVDGKRFTKINGLNANTILYRESEKQFIIAGGQGIFVFDDKFKEVWSYPSNFSRFLGAEIDPQNENVIWLGTLSSGLLRLSDKDTDFRIEEYGALAGLLDNMGKPILYEDEVMFGAKDGLFYFVDEEEMKINLTEEEKKNSANYKGMFQSFPIGDSIFNGQLLSLVKGGGRTWFCNEFKIGYYDHQRDTFANRPFWGINFGRINEFYLEDERILWIGAEEGVIRYENNLSKNYNSHFYSLIRRVKSKNAEDSKDSILFNGVHTNNVGAIVFEQLKNKIIEIDFKYNDIEFLFSAPYFEDEHKPKYRYILEGESQKWSKWGTKSEMTYNNLQEGEYTFKVEAENIYGQISEKASYSFIILPPWYRTSWAYFLYALGFLLILLFGVHISSKRLKAKNLWLEGVIEERTKEISKKNIVLEHQKKEIRDSINYASRIQIAILPLEEEMKKWLPNSFVLFRPKDIVSGDFYWFIERDDKLIIICADCTGHGVPGAFMSMIGSDRLNNIVSENKITSPGAILSELNRAIKKSLKQDGHKNATRDGMDAAVCTIDLKTNTLMYAGAYRPLWIIENGEFKEIKATKVAIAGFTKDDQVYKEHEIELKEGQKFYMTTDGYADQFGGLLDKKYMVKSLKKFVTAHANMSFDMQKMNLEKELLDWMGESKQIDDVCIIGFEPDQLALKLKREKTKDV